MKRNMLAWKDEVIASPVKKAIPILSFPSVQLMGISVKELIADSKTQAKAMKLLTERNDSLAAVSMMDLSVEAEAFGAEIQTSDDEVPVVVGALVKTQEDADNLRVPQVGEARTQIYIDAMKEAVQLIEDRPVFAGVIGPYSLAGRLLGMTGLFKVCKRNPAMVHTVMEKCTAFLIEFMKAYKDAGANGVMIAEPLTGLLSPKMAAELSNPYVKQIIDTVQTEDFAVMYHNCGNNVMLMMDDLLQLGAIGYHWGNAIEMKDAVEKCPADLLVMGNVDPALFVFGTTDSIYAQTRKVMDACCYAPNFVISSGCDIAPIAKWDNIDAFYQAATDFYKK